MAGMSTLKHHYTFEVSRPAPSSVATGGTQRFHAGAIGTSPAAAEQVVRDRYPTATLLTLSLVQPAGERCGDERCAVCYPSSRNQGTL
jgi:hypothetical protein